jgi:hypothetical protein
MNAPLRAAGDIRRVTVFRNGALVERAVTVEPGEVEVTGLPLLIAADTLRVRADGGDVRDLEETASLDATAAGGPEPAIALEALELEVEALERARQRVADAERALQTISPRLPAEDDPTPLPDAAQWLTAHEQLADRLDALAQERADLEKKLRGKRDELRRLATRGDTEAAPPRYSRAVRFRLEADEAREVRVEYFVPAARWVPSYTLHLEDGRARLTLAALVSQASGEDWGDAQLRFSTADLTRASTLPELLSWRMGRKQPPRAPRFRDLPDDLDELFAGWDRGSTRPLPVPPAPTTPPDSFEFDDSTGIDREDEDEESVSGAYPLGDMEPEPITAALESIEADFDDDLLEAPEEMAKSYRMEAKSSPVRKRASAPPPPPGAAPMPQAAPASIAAGGMMFKADLAFGGGGEAAAEPAPPPEPLPPKLRYAYLRLRGADEGQRGQLIPVGAIDHLYQLVEDHGAAHESDLRRAVAALERAAARLRVAPLPTGGVSLDGCAFHHVYAAPGAHAIPGDGVYHRLEVDRFDAPANVEFRTIPREAPEIYRFCVLDSPAGVPLPRGPLHVYEDGAFRVTSRLDQDGGGSALELNLGVEEALRLDGRVVNVRQSEKGMLSSRSSVEHSVTVRFRSGLDAPANLVVFDRLPVANEQDEKELTVELLEADPTPRRTEEGPQGETLRGALRWSVQLPPGEERAISYRYAVELPAKAEVLGGNRRE